MFDFCCLAAGQTTIYHGQSRAHLWLAEPGKYLVNGLKLVFTTLIADLQEDRDFANNGKVPKGLVRKDGFKTCL